MSFALEIKTGIDAGKAIGLPKGHPVRVGRGDDVEVVIHDDPTISRVHFSLEWTGSTVLLRDLGSSFGTWLDGVRITSGTVMLGSMIVAGQTTFALRNAESSIANELLPAAVHYPVAHSTASLPKAESQDLLALLQTLPEPLFALLDAARDPSILPLLKESHEEYQSLYEGTKGKELAEWAPYLVRITSTTRSLENLIRNGWGKSWGVFLTSSEPFREVRKQLRRFLEVQWPDGSKVYFRYYDPRVLRVFLPTCTPEEKTEFFGPIKQYVMEGPEPNELLWFANSSAIFEVYTVSIPLTLGTPHC